MRLALCFLATTFASTAALSECRTAQDVRIDHADQLDQLSGVCYVTGALAIFPDDVESLVLPDLVKATFINITSSSLKAVALPKLRSTGTLVLRSPNLEAIELTRLEAVGGTFEVTRGDALRYLSVPALVSVGDLYIADNPALEFVFAENLESLHTFYSRRNPTLKEESRSYLEDAVRPLPAPVVQQRHDVATGLGDYRYQLVTSYVNPDMPPTGHPTYFGSIGSAPQIVRQYYDVYPYHYDGLWSYYLARYRFYRWLY